MPANYTKQQLQAINIHGCDLLVAAAAGSGKTAVLVERIIRLVTGQGQKPVDIDRLLVVTFTDAAAAEMRMRISKALYECIYKDPNNEHLCRQAALLDKASITTIHSFCSKVIRQNFHLLDIDPAFKIADDAEKKLLKAQVMTALFEDEYSINDNEAFFNLVESYGGSKTSDDALRDLILNVFEFISSYPWPTRWIERAVEMFAPSEGDSAAEALGKTEWAKIIREDFILELTGARDSIAQAKKLCMQPGGPIKYMDALNSDLEIIESLLKKLTGLVGQNFDFEYVYTALNSVKHAKLASYSGKSKEQVSSELCARVKTIRDKHIKTVIKKLRAIFIKPPSQLYDDVVSLYAPLVKLKELVLNFSERYAAEKKERNIVDFNDLEQFCLKILLDENSSENLLIPSKTAETLRSRYDEVFIDEYQDSNLVQELILASLRVPRFMVGDVKQSIYKFRRAKPELFMQKYRDFTSLPDDFTAEYSVQNSDKQIKIDLSKNFRSRECVLDIVNFLFCQIMTNQTGGISYDKNAALYFGADFGEELPLEDGNISDSTELLIIDRSTVENLENAKDYTSEEFFNPESEIYSEISESVELSDIAEMELEARLISLRIKELVSPGGMNVYDKQIERYRRAQYSDIVVLMRSIRTNAEILINTLKESGIPAFANSPGGYFNSLEIQTILSILQIIDNPLQDIHILTVLRSPMYALSSNELLEIHNIAPNERFYDCVKKYIEASNEFEQNATLAKLQKFYIQLETWRDRALHTPISQLIDDIYWDTGYVNLVSGMSAGAVRAANLRILHERAAQYESTSFKGLFHFIRYVERLQRTEIDMDDAKVMSENENTVKIMTIHKSKGLEFPIVFVSGLGRGFNFMDERKTVIMHQDLGFGAYHIDLETRIKSRTLPHLALALKMRAESLAEELRTLYVALTRAKEKLILTGCVKNYDKVLEKWQLYADYEHTELPPHYVLGAKNYLDWIAAAMYRQDCVKIFPANFGIQIITVDEVCNREEIMSVQESSKLEELVRDSKFDDSLVSDIFSKLEWEYPYQAESALPGKISISEIKRLYQMELLNGNAERIDPASLASGAMRRIHAETKLPAFLTDNQKPSAGEIGTAIHCVMEHLDFFAHLTYEDIQTLINTLVCKNIIEKSTADFIPVTKIHTFVNSSTADRIRASKNVFREKDFVMALSPEEVYRKKEFRNFTSKLIVHGIIDCYFEEGDGYVLLDYKSDFVTNANAEEAVQVYRPQLEIYARAIESSGKQVKEMLLYLFAIDKPILLRRA